MTKKDSYKAFLQDDFDKLFEMMKLSDVQKHFLRSRWLDQLLWMEGKANKARDRYYALRLTTIIGGVILPALISFNTTNENAKRVVFWSTFGISQVVAMSAAIEEFFHYGERWRHYRRTCESLKTQAWQFSQLSGVYRNYTNHDEAFNVFAGQIEDIIQRDVEVYSTQVVQDKKEAGEKQENFVSLLPKASVNNEAQSAEKQES
jgi:hypothetical protein